MTALIKDESILELIDRLELPTRGWFVADHWEADLCATGIESATRPGRLVYVSTFGKSPGFYDYERELPANDPEEVYVPDGGGKDVSFDELLRILVAHLDA